jgi:hypothetical protein
MKGSRTALVALLLVVLGALQSFEWVTIVSDAVVAGRIVAGIGIVMMVLRAMTDTALFSDK